MRVGPPACSEGGKRWAGTGLTAARSHGVGGEGVLVEEGVPGPVLDGLTEEDDGAGGICGPLCHASSIDHHGTSIDRHGATSVIRWPTTGSKSRPTAS